MPTLGKSLLGFMEEDAALQYLRKGCFLPGDQSDARLRHEYQTAKNKIGQKFNAAGRPEILDIPQEFSGYISTLKDKRWLRPEFDGSLKGAEFKLVEIEPLLAIQFSVGTARSTDLTSSLQQPCELKHLLEICLPHTPAGEALDVINGRRAQTSIGATSKNLSLKVKQEGAMLIEDIDGRPRIFLGTELAYPIPLVHVVRFQGNCYMHNGYHRAYGAAMAGAKHIPCIFRDVDYAFDVGIQTDETFGLDVLQSSNPPTIGHLVRDRAHDVQFKDLKLIFHVSWSEYLTDD